MKKTTFIIILLSLCSILLVEAFPDTLSAAQENDLSSLLKQLKTYEPGKNDSLILKLNQYLRSRRSNQEEKLKCELQLLSFLKSDATESAKMEVCRHLRIIGSKKSVPVLEGMLLEKETTDMARYVLEKIPDKAADEALLKSLPKTKGLIKAGIVSSLGHRRVPEAVPHLKKTLEENQDLMVSLAAAAALGHIRNAQAVEALSMALSKTSGELKMQVAGSLLKCAEEYLSNKSIEKAQNIYGQILNSDLPSSFYHSAARGKISSAEGRGDEVIIEKLKTSQKDLSPYLEMIPEYFDSSTIPKVCALLPSLSDPEKVQLISVLSLYSKKEVLQTVLKSVESQSQKVRTAALKTLQQIGNSSTVGFLAQYAASSKGEDQQQARASLWGLKGDDIDSTITSKLSTEKNPEIQIEYIKAAEERQIYSAKEIIFERLSFPNPKVRSQAIQSLKKISSPEDLPKLIDSLKKVENDQHRQEMISTIAYTALKIPDPLKKGEAVTRALPEAKDPGVRSSLYLILGMIGDDSTLPVLRKGLKESHEMIHGSVVRALANWPNPTAADDLLHLVRTSEKQELQIICLRSFIRMVEMEPFRRPEAAVRSLEQALELALRPSEKTMVLGVLPKFACEEAADLARRLIKDKEVEQEARKALNLIKEKLDKIRD